MLNQYLRLIHGNVREQEKKEKEPYWTVSFFPMTNQVFITKIKIWGEKNLKNS